MVLKRPSNTIEKGLPATIPVSVVQVVEPHPPKDAEPVHWILLTTHDAGTLEHAWRIVEWYRRRWIIEQFFRTLKQQGLRIEDSQLTTADRLCRLIAIAASAAAIVMQLVQARDGNEKLAADIAFSDGEIELLARSTENVWHDRTARTILTPREPWPGPHGSSQGSEVGPATTPPQARARGFPPQPGQVPDLRRRLRLCKCAAFPAACRT